VADEVVLRIVYADGRLEERQFSPGKYRVGRELGDLVLGGDPKVSARHAEIVVADEQVTITDLGSRNGILDRAGKRLDGTHRLVVDQTLTLGRSHLTLVRGIACPGWTVADSEASPVSPPASSGPRHASTTPRQRQPSITRANLDEARNELKFWRVLVKALGLAFAVTVLFGLYSLSSGDDSVVLLSGMTTIASGSMLAWLVKRRDEAREDYKQAQHLAAMGTAQMGRPQSASPGSVSTPSLWQFYRTLPLLAQAVILFYAWWLVIPIWILSSGKSGITRNV
jgi:hypothetical protein